ncbi:trigger factor [Candidatus Peregrinibacteria bacterium RIFOXYB2_FULL_32_7]|nr:MAG: trigger factor [Candidatus Peregrinibacteria bacterium RIFOXYB2_FULL_32_7]
MKVTTKSLPKSEILFHIEVDETEMRKFRLQASLEISKEVKVDGFRPGHIPYEILIQKVGEDYIEMFAQEKAVSNMYRKALEQEKIMPLATGELKVIEKKPFIFEIKAAVNPEITFKNLDKILIKREKIEVKDKEIEDLIESYRMQKSSWHDTDEKVKKGHRAEVDFEGFDLETKASLPNTKSSNHPLVIGDNMMVPGFEEAIIGMKKNEEKEFEVTFPKDYHSENMKGKKVKFQVKVNRVEEREMPELNEKFIEETVGEKISIDEFKKRVKENIEHEKIHAEQKRQEDEFLKKLNEESKMEVSDLLVEKEMENMLEQQKSAIEKNYKIEWKRYLEIIKKNEEDMKKEMNVKALERIKTSFLVEKALEVEQFSATDHEINKKIEDYLKNIPKKDQSLVKKAYKKDSEKYRSLMYSMKVEKLFEKHIEGYGHECH